MNIIEAIKSGKPFRANKSDNPLYIKNFKLYFKDDQEYEYHITVRDILEENWEIQEKSITITESQFDEAWKKRISVHFNCVGHINDELDLTESIRDDFKKDLGW